MSNQDVKLLLGNSLEVLKTIPDNFVDSIVTDPPYGIALMGKRWDYQVPSVELWKQCLRVLKPGAHIIVACGTRTQHRMAVNIEDGGFDIRDIIAWVYLNGFPSPIMNIDKEIDKLLGYERKRVPPTGGLADGSGNSVRNYTGFCVDDTPLSEEAKQWYDWGTSLKPAAEYWTLARKPIAEKTIVENVLKQGAGALNIHECRIKDDKTSLVNDNCTTSSGRYPANIITDGNEIIRQIFPNNTYRVFYCPKPSKKERNIGLDDFEEKRHADTNKEDGAGGNNPRNITNKPNKPKKNFHPTVKPLELMKYLCRLVTPRKGIVLDPFMGSGTTGMAAKIEGFSFIGIDNEKEYLEIAEARINHVKKKNKLI